MSVLCFACVPVVIKLTAQHSDPFWFNTAAMTAQALVLAVLLAATTSVVPAVGWRHVGRVELLGVGAAAPMVWLVASRMEYAFFAWSVTFVDAAITAALFRLWPLVMVLILARHAAGLRSNGIGDTAAQRRLSTRQGALMVLAVPAAATVAASQLDTVTAAADGWGTAIWGAGLAVAGAVLAGVSPAASLMLGDRIQRLRGPGRDDGAVAAQRVWYAVAVHAVSAAMVVPFSAAIAAATADVSLDARGVCGAVLTGTLSALAAIGLRVANALSSDLKINAAFYLITPLSLAGLAVTGIDIARMWLFAAGTAAVLTLTAAVEISDRSAGVARGASQDP